MDYQANKIVLGFDIQPRTIRLIPKLSIAALQHGLDKELAMWYCLRTINHWGSGYLDRQYAVNSLHNTFHYSRSTAYRLLRKGEGIFWSKFHNNNINSLHIKICALSKVSDYLATFCGRYYIEVPVSEFSGLKGHRVLKQRAWLYSTFHRLERINARPISRASISEATGICRRSQQRYDNIAAKRHANFAVKHDSNGRLQPLLQAVKGKSQEWLMHKRLGNSYLCRGYQGRSGMLRKVNAAIRQSFSKGEACRKRRFFTSVKKYLKSPQQFEDSYILVPPDTSLKPGRVEWCLV